VYRGLSIDLLRMPNRIPAGRKGPKPAKGKKLSVATEYVKFFVPTPSPLWQRDDDGFSLDQPSPYKWVQTVTTYGIGTTLCPMADA